MLTDKQIRHVLPQMFVPHLNTECCAKGHTLYIMLCNSVTLIVQRRHCSFDKKMSLLFLVFVVSGIVLGTCQELVYYGPKSSGADDATSSVTCPPAFYGVNCECSKDSSKCDGAYFHEDGNCKAHNTWKQGGIRARVTCEPLESLVRFTSVRSAGWVRDPEATCPLGSRLIHCGLHHPWMQDESNTEFDIISDTAQNQCKLGNKKCKQCALVARCASL